MPNSLERAGGVRLGIWLQLRASGFGLQASGSRLRAIYAVTRVQARSPEPEAGSHSMLVMLFVLDLSLVFFPLDAGAPAASVFQRLTASGFGADGKHR